VAKTVWRSGRETKGREKRGGNRGREVRKGREEGEWKVASPCISGVSLRIVPSLFDKNKFSFAYSTTGSRRRSTSRRRRRRRSRLKRPVALA